MRWLVLALVSAPLWGFMLLGLIFDTADFLLGMGIMAVMALSVFATLAVATRGR